MPSNEQYGQNAQYDRNEQHKEIKAFLREAEGGLGLSLEGAEMFSIAGDGSDRKFYRVRKGSSHMVALFSPRRKEEGTDENDSYLLIGNHLRRRGIPVPLFLYADPAGGRFLLEDLGDLHLQDAVTREHADVHLIYGRVVGLLVKLHRHVPEGFEASFCFDTHLYDPPFVYSRELEYFRHAFLINYLGLDISPEDLRRDFENLAEAAGVNSSSMVIHRDFQSRNIMIHGEELRLLDFQGMRFGPPAYDLASLLVDPYVDLPPAIQEGLLDMYWSGIKSALNTSYDRFLYSYRALRLCRNLQVLGAYGFLGVARGKKSFLGYIPSAWRRLNGWLDGPCKDQYPDLQRIVKSLGGDVRLRKASQ